MGCHCVCNDTKAPTWQAAFASLALQASSANDMGSVAGLERLDCDLVASVQ